MGSDVLRVAAEGIGPRAFVARLGRVQERAQRHLGVDEDVLALGEVDPHVRAHGGVVGSQSPLQVEVAALEHPSDLGDPLELGLAPRTANLGLAQSCHERRSLPAQRLAGLLDGPDVRAHVGGHGDPFLLHVGEPALKASRLARTGAITCSVAFSRASAEASTALACRSAVSAARTLNWLTMLSGRRQFGRSLHCGVAPGDGGSHLRAQLSRLRLGLGRLRSSLGDLSARRRSDLPGPRQFGLGPRGLGAGGFSLGPSVRDVAAGGGNEALGLGVLGVAAGTGNHHSDDRAQREPQEHADNEGDDRECVHVFDSAGTVGQIVAGGRGACRRPCWCPSTSSGHLPSDAWNRPRRGGVRLRVDPARG